MGMLDARTKRRARETLAHMLTGEESLRLAQRSLDGDEVALAKLLMAEREEIKKSFEGALRRGLDRIPIYDVDGEGSS